MGYYVLFFILYLLNQCKSMEKIKGVNIGGWLVLEPWITPSLFYPFLGKNKNKIAMDMYTFCETLGPFEANKRLLNHWFTWFTEEYIQILSKNGINLLRVPIGDWMYIPYGPFLKMDQGKNTKCTDGSIEMLDNLFILAEKYNMKVLLDLHGVKGSQNGFDNSGQSMDIEIINNTFRHWDIRKANWIGSFDLESKTYPILNEESIRHSKTVLLYIIRKYYNYKMFYGLCVLNEPWEFTPELFLKGFYQDIFNIFTEYMSSDKVFVIHDSFRSIIWEDFELMENYKNITILIDTHQYTAWNSPYESFDNLIHSTSTWQSPHSKYKYLIGEWSLAIDNCEMWLNGFMDNVPSYPLFECSYAVCPKYRQFSFELSQSIFGPFGSGESYPKKNIKSKIYECPITIPLVKHFPTLQALEKDIVNQLFISKTSAFEKETAGWIFWNFRTESESYQWDYLAYLKLTNNIDINNVSKKKHIIIKSLSNINVFQFICIIIFLVMTFFITILFIINKIYKFKNNNKNSHEYTVIGSTQYKTYDSINI